MTAERTRARPDIELELISRNHEEALFAARVADGTIRIIRCIEGGLLVEAERIASGLHYVANRHRRQRTDGGAA